MNDLEALVKNRNTVAEKINELLSVEESVHCDTAEERDRVLEIERKA